MFATMEYSFHVRFTTSKLLHLLTSRSRTCIHKFPNSSISDSPTLNSPCAITALVQSPAIDVVGIGFTSGEVSVYDVRADERLLRIFMDGGSIKALAFRTGELLSYFSFYFFTY